MLLETLSTEQLRTFALIAETGSYTATAERLFRSQPAISLQIKRLEEQIGSRLLERSGRVSSLTEAGRILLGYAKRILDLNEEALAKLTLADATGTVRVGVLEEVTHNRLVRLLTRFGRLATGIRIELDVSTSWDLAKRVQANELCLAIANTAYSPMAATPLWNESYLWAQSVDTDFSGETSIPLISDPLDSPCVGCQDAISALQHSGRAYHVVFSSMSLLATQAAVRAGLGVGMIAESAITEDMEILGPDDGYPELLPSNIGLYRGTEATGAAASSLFDFLVSHLQQRDLVEVSGGQPSESEIVPD